MGYPLVSIIIPVYNRPIELQRALQSVENNFYTNYEAWVVDDGSTKDNAEKHEFICGQFAKVNYIFQQNAGPGVARNNGLSKATGKYIQYLDSDDELLPEKLIKQVSLLEKRVDVSMVFGKSYVNEVDSSKIHRRKDLFPSSTHFSLSLQAMKKRIWHTSACLWRNNYPSQNSFWEPYYNGEDVLHDVKFGLQISDSGYFQNEFVCLAHNKSSTNRLSVSNDYSRKIGFVRVSNKLKKYLKTSSFSRELSNAFYERLVFAALDNQRMGNFMLSKLFFKEAKQYGNGFRSLEVLFFRGVTPALSFYYYNNLRRVLIPSLASTTRYISQD